MGASHKKWPTIILAASSFLLCNLDVVAQEAASSVPALQSSDVATYDAEMTTPASSTLQREVERLKELKPKQLAEEQKALYEAMQKMTDEQRAEKREEMLRELENMSPTERKFLHDERQTETEKLLSQEHEEHGGD
jgi:Skp family chaperone for outer membrane proteins